MTDRKLEAIAAKAAADFTALIHESAGELNAAIAHASSPTPTPA